MMTDKDKAIREVSLRGVESAEDVCATLNADTISATVKWFDHKDNKSPGLLVWKLRNEPLYVSSDEDGPAPAVWKEENRLAWIELNMPEEIEKDEGFRAEVAIIGIVRAKLPVTVERVRLYMQGELVSGDRKPEPPMKDPPAKVPSNLPNPLKQAPGYRKYRAA